MSDKARTSGKDCGLQWNQAHSDGPWAQESVHSRDAGGRYGL